MMFMAFLLAWFLAAFPARTRHGTGSRKGPMDGACPCGVQCHDVVLEKAAGMRGGMSIIRNPDRCRSILYFS